MKKGILKFEFFRQLSTFDRVLVILCIFVVFSLFSSRLLEIPSRSALRGWDNSFYLMWVRSAVIDHDLDFSNEIEINNTIAPNQREKIQNLPLTEIGKVPNKYGIGWGLLSLPFFLLADSVVITLRFLGYESLPRDGYNYIYQIVLQCGHLFYAFLGLAFAYKLCALFFTREIALRATLITWASSMLTYYQSLNLSMTHSLTFSLVAVCYYYSMRIWKDVNQATFKNLSILFLVSGLLVVTRYQAAVYLLFPAICICRLLYQMPQAYVRRVSLAFLFAVIPVGLQMLAWKSVYGSYLVSTYGENNEGFIWNDPAFVEVLFSPNHGLFYWHPFLLLSTLAFSFWIFKIKPVGFIWTASVLITYLVNASWWCWWLGSSFGLRNFEASVLFAILGTAYLFCFFEGKRYWLKALQIVGIFCVLWNFNLAILYSTNVISRNSAVTYQEMLRTSVEFYPKVSTLAWEYLTGSEDYDLEPREGRDK